MRPPKRLSNRSIIGFGLLLCVAGAVLLAYLLGALGRFGALS